MGRVLAAVWISLAILGCGPSYGVSRSVVDWNGETWTEHPPASRQPPRPSGCELESLTSVAPRETSHYIAIGTVWFVGGDVTSADVADNVRRRACALGGEAVMLVQAARTFRSGGMATFLVLRRGARR
jgi:hypothetical protein